MAFSDVEYGYYFSDWNENDGLSGVSNYCQSQRKHTTLSIDISTDDDDWAQKIGALSVIDSSGIIITRNIITDLSTTVGYVWSIIFKRQPGTYWPHEYIAETPQFYETASIRWNSDTSEIVSMFNDVKSNSGEVVFGESELHIFPLHMIDGPGDMYGL